MAVLGAVSVTASACGSSLIGSATSTPPSSSPSVSSQQRSALAKDGPLNSEVAVAFPVAACATSSDHPLESDGWLPTILLAPIPTGLVGKVEFYSDGFHTVLGPTGWICQQTVDIEGTITGLTVYPPGTADHCSGIPPNGQQTSLATPDVVSVTDPAGVAGSLEGSGGFHPVTGTVIFPQSKAVTYGSSVDIALESCSLTDSSLCPTILSDFDVREFPVPAANGYSYGSR
jgi:hypothetical protein